MQEPCLSPPPGEQDEDPLAFTPVTGFAERHNGWTERRQRDFIEALSIMGVVSRAAKAVGMTKQSSYVLRRRPEAQSWARAWNAALQRGYDRTFEIARDRAITDVTRPRYYKGREVGTRTTFDYRLALAALDPSKPPSARPRLTE
jgi:hypothetical protein